MNILVTGSNGLIGRHIVKFLLHKDLNVVGFDLKPTLADYIHFTNFTFIEGSVSDYYHLESVMEKYKIDKIIHGGGISHPKGYENSPDKILNTNIMGTSNVLEAGRLATVQQIVLLSSAAVYGSNQTTNLNEDVAPTPTSIYGVSKITSEYLANVYHEIHGMNITSLRIPFVYGPGRKTHDPIKHMLEKALNDEDVIEEVGIDQKLEYIYVKDVVRAIWLTINTKRANGITLNIGSGNLTSSIDIISVMKQLFPRLKFELGPGDFGYDEVSPLNCTKAREILNFKTSYSIMDGISEYHDLLKNK
ncbi:NAD-dependent epimerase/dehydratase family protein [Gracilibacillus thailandensis]|uniref:NAD-dependent epimerase/dehydratase family protein n=1 Tax=Gracilibacillus thailandensis TaxID=563735 RepID=A0A6N7QVJ8_9BACI|nr:NAD(P)-dependent oxidoreductase [Gracilibacillus thailandensis]MRI66123.1 NAD-dependent epimerase/dehydratase family protein [Gracilibacillus thailandensis]